MHGTVDNQPRSMFFTPRKHFLFNFACEEAVHRLVRRDLTVFLDDLQFRFPAIADAGPTNFSFGFELQERLPSFLKVFDWFRPVKLVKVYAVYLETL